MFSEDGEVRRAVVTHFQKLAEDRLLMTARTKAVLLGQMENLLSDDPGKWRRSAVVVSDLVKDDWLCNLAAVRQCLEMHFNNGVEEFLTAVMRPTISAVEPIVESVWAPREQGELIEKTILDLVPGASLTDALNAYYHALGHIPFGGKLSISRMVTEWESRHKKVKDLWGEVWAWANGIPSPLPRYHACSIFLGRTGDVPEGHLSEFWEEIAGVVHLPNTEDADLPCTQAWRIRLELAQHFQHHLESRLPGMDGERIATQAWWLAERVAMLFGQDSKSLREVRRVTFEPEALISRRVWNTGRPPMRRSRFSYAAGLTRHIWGLSLLCQLDKTGLESLRPDMMTAAIHERIELAMLGAFVSGFPLTAPGNPVYAFDKSIASAGQDWLTLFGAGENREKAGALLAAVEKMARPEELATLLEVLPSASESDHVLVGFALRGLAYSGEAPVEALWARVSDRSWLESLFLRAKPYVVEIFFDSLLEIEIREQGRWRYGLPHAMALMCEAAAEDAERRPWLFGLTVVGSIAADSVSAIQRLLRGDHRSQFTEDAASWNKRIAEMRPYSPEWLKGGFRATLAALNA